MKLLLKQLALVVYLVCLISGQPLGAGEPAVSPSAEDAFKHRSFTGAPDILPVDEAFRFGFVPQGDSVRLFWQIMPGYYLYREKFGFRIGDEVLTVELRSGIPRVDEVFGPVEVYDGLLELTMPPLPNGTEIEVSYQGCADQGYCYPPQKKLASVDK